MIFNMGSNGITPKNNIDALTITPGKVNRVIPEGTYLRGALTVLGDSDLTANNIREGVNIFGVTGTMEEGFTDIAFGTVTPSQDTDQITVYFNLSNIPTFASVACLTKPSQDYLRRIYYDKYNGAKGFYSSLGTTETASAKATVETTSTSMKVSGTINIASTQAKFQAGVTYAWVAVVV